MRTGSIILSCLILAAVEAAQTPVGTWEWLETAAADGSITTPDDLGYPVRRESADDHTYRLYHGCTPEATGTCCASEIMGDFAAGHLGPPAECYAARGPVANEVLTWARLKTLYR